jgi:hypothetical protein
MITSNAEWTKVSPTRDTHETVEQARSVCNLLMIDYGRHEECPIRGKCIKAWVEVDGENKELEDE